MQAVWKGSIAFGLVNIPVKMYVASENHDVSFRQVHAEDGGRIQYKKTCSVCGRVLTVAEISRAVETESGELLVLDEDAFADLPVRSSREIEVLQFVPGDQVDPVLFDKSYYLEPDERSAKSYVLLREALAHTERTAIVMVSLRQKTHLAALRISDGKLALQTMWWADELRHPVFPALDQDIALKPAELAMAASLIESMAADFDPSQYRDEYRDALLAVVAARESGGTGILEQPAAEAEAGEVLDLMAALKASVARARTHAAPTAVLSTSDKVPAAEAKVTRVTKARKSTSTAEPAAEPVVPERKPASKNAR